MNARFPTPMISPCSLKRLGLLIAVALLGCSVAARGLLAEETSLGDSPATSSSVTNSKDLFKLELPGGIGGPERWTSPEGLTSALEVMVLLTVVSLAPAALMMTTCFVRIAVVLGLLRQALGTQQLPPNQVMTSIALFMTLLVMSPVWLR